MKRFTSWKSLWAFLVAAVMVFAVVPASADSVDASELPFNGDSVFDVDCDSITIHYPDLSGDYREEDPYQYWLKQEGWVNYKRFDAPVEEGGMGAELGVPFQLEPDNYILELDVFAGGEWPPIPHETVDHDPFVIEGCEEPPVNQAPVVQNLEMTTMQDTPVSGTVDVIDPNVDDTLTYVVSDAGNGTATNMGAAVNYTPNPGWFGVDSFVMTATDQHGLFDTGTVTVTVLEAEEQPVDPAGVMAYDVSQCETLGINTPTGIQPVGADWQYFIDAEMIGVGEYSVSAGEYLLELDVNGVNVDSDTITITECDGDEPEPTRDYLRWGGADRYGTAAEFALNGKWAPGGTGYIATAHEMPDALAMAGASTGAGSSVNTVGVTVDGPPILLVKQGQIPQMTRVALDQLQPSRIVVAGSTATISVEVEHQLGAWASVERLGGADRYETAAKIATQADHDVVYLASGEVFADALSVGPLSRWTGGAVLLAKQGKLPKVTADALAQLQPARLVIVGGSDRVSDSVAQAAADAAGLEVSERIAGADRYETAQLVAMSFPKDVPTSTLVVATGVDYPDALTAGAYAGNRGAPVLLTRPNSLPQGTATAAQYRPAEHQVVLAGGENSVSADVFNRLPSLFE